jgi:hypothetical protein
MNCFSGVLIYEDVHSDESDRTEEEDILVSVEIREEEKSNQSTSSEDEECQIKENEDINREGCFLLKIFVTKIRFFVKYV